MSGIASAIGLGVGLVGTVGKLFSAGKANSQLNALIGQDPTYTANPIAGQRLGLAQQLLNARQPGAANAEANIYGNQASTQANIERNATDSSQALAAGAGAQGQTNQAFTNLGAQEASGYMGRVQNLAGAQQGEINEGDKVYQDQVRRFGDLAQIRGAQNQNRQSAWGSVANAGSAVTSFGLQGGFSKIFGGGGGSTAPQAASGSLYGGS
jgi:hypothetical protein